MVQTSEDPGLEEGLLESGAAQSGPCSSCEVVTVHSSDRYQ